MLIGDIEIPIVGEIEESLSADVDEISPLPPYSDSIDHVGVKHEPSVRTVIFTVYLNEELHSDSLSLAEQKSQMKKLRKKKIEQNNINYFGYKGHLSVQDVSFSDNGDSAIINEVEIETRFLPWPKFISESDP